MSWASQVRTFASNLEGLAGTTGWTVIRPRARDLTRVLDSAPYVIPFGPCYDLVGFGGTFMGAAKASAYTASCGDWEADMSVALIEVANVLDAFGHAGQAEVAGSLNDALAGAAAEADAASVQAAAAETIAETRTVGAGIAAAVVAALIANTIITLLARR